MVTHTSNILRLEKPDACDLGYLRKWLDSNEGGACFLRRLPIEGLAWTDQRNSDLVTLKRRDDRFAAWIMNNLLPVYHRWIGNYIHKQRTDDLRGKHFHYPDSYFMTISNLVCTILSTAIPSSSILVLYFVENMLARLLIIIAFSLLLSLIMAFVSHGRRYEIFAATFAFAAVQVVFVGSVDAA